MNIEVKVKIETEKIDVELTQNEARVLYEQLKEFFEVEEKTVYIPYTYINPLAPSEQKPWWIPDQPYFIGDVPYNAGHVTFSCGECKND